MSSTVYAWGHNPGQMAVKDVIDGLSGKPTNPTPYPAVIAPWAKSDELGLQRGARLLEATIVRTDTRGKAVEDRYLGGIAAQRMATAMRQMSAGRLEPDSPLYRAFVQMSFAHSGLAKRANGAPPTVAITTALPISWKDASAEDALRTHLREGLQGLAQIRWIDVKSEPAAVVLSEMLDEDGVLRGDTAALGTGLVCVADLGGSTLNRAVLDKLQPVPGQADSPYLGSFTAIRELMVQAGMQQVDAEQRLLAALSAPGTDPAADGVLRRYRDQVVAELQQAWRSFRPLQYLIAGGTSLWVIEAIKRAFGPTVRHVAKPQLAIASGLHRYTRMRLRREQRGR